MEKEKAICILQAVKAGTADVFIRKAAIKDALDMAISALEKQEQTKEAVPHRDYQYLSDYWCECGWHLGKKGNVKFCANCGKRIKWDMGV